MPFVLQSLRKGSVLVLPPSQIKVVYSKPEHHLNARGPGAEGISAAYTMLDPAVIPSNFDVDYIRQQINKRYDELSADLQEELAFSIDEHVGTSGDWKKIHLWQMTQQVMTKGLNRVMVGSPLCKSSVQDVYPMASY